MEKIEKKLINFDEAEYRRQIIDFTKTRDLLNQIAELYENLFTGKITRERLGQVLAGNYPALREATIDSVKKSVKNFLLAEVAIERTEERLEEFETEAAKLVYRFNQICHSTLTPPEWFEQNSEGRFYLPEATNEKIRERCSNYITTPEEFALYEALQQVATGYTKFLAGWGQFTKDYMPATIPIDHFLSFENDVVTPRPNIDYLSLTR